VNDFNPGVDDDTGLFWTKPVPDNCVHVHPGRGTASFHLEDFETEDYHNINNALADGPSDPAVVSFEMRWSGHGKHLVQSDGSTFTFHSVIGTATIEWTAVNEATGMHFASDPASTSHSSYAAVGHEKNGVFVA